MSERRNSRFWWVLLAAIVASGILSRVGQTGYRVVDKYLGDTLYAAMVYVILPLSKRVSRVALGHRWRCSQSSRSSLPASPLRCSAAETPLYASAHA
jgi:hypothetical protein